MRRKEEKAAELRLALKEARYKLNENILTDRDGASMVYWGGDDTLRYLEYIPKENLYKWK
jgi:hypothetical protein